MDTLSLSECITALKQSGVSYTHVANEIGCDTSTLYRIRTGEIADPKDSVARKLRDLAERHLGTKKRRAA